MNEEETHDTPFCLEHGLSLPDKEWNEEQERWICPECEWVCPEHGLSLPDKEWNEEQERWICPKCEGE